MLDETQESPLQLLAADDLLGRTSIDTQLEMNKLDDLYWGANRSWHEGQGQTRLDVPPRFQIDPSTASSPYKHLRSKGVDITIRGQLTLLHATAKVLALTNQDPNPEKIAVTDSYAYVISGPQTVQRFSNVTASDAASQNLNAASTGVAVDLATDGGIAYAALGIDGINRVLPAAFTQQDSADSATGWAATNGTLTLDTTDKKEGTGSIKVISGASSPMTVRKTFAAAKDFSGVDNFYYWAKLENTASGFGVGLRAETDTSNYFQASVGQSFIQGGAGWIRFLIPRTASFVTTVGTPSWTNINSFALIITALPNGTIFHIDDLDTQVFGNWATWGTWDARALGWVNDRLYAAGVKSGTQWRFYEAASGTGGAERYVLPDGWVVTDICGLSGLVYFAAYRGGKGVVYSYDGSSTNAPQIACQVDAIGNGTIPLSLTPFSGAGILIGCRRLTSSLSAGLGVVYRGFPDAAGALRLERVALLGADDGSDYGVRCGLSYGDYSYFGWSFADSEPGANFLVDQTKRTGLGIYWPETGAYGRSYQTPTGTAVNAIVEDIAVFKGRRMFTVGGMGVFLEQTTYEPEGGVVSSLIDVNVAADKVWLAEESYYMATEAIPSPVAHAYSLDGTTWSNDTGGGGAGSSVRIRTSFNALGLKTPSIYARTRLLTVSGTVTPALYQTGIGGYPAVKPLPTFVLALRAYPASEQLDIARSRLPDAGYAALAKLLGLWTNQTIIDFQPPWAFSDQTTLPAGISYRVRVSDLQIDKGWFSNAEQGGGLVTCKLKVVP